MSYSRVVITGLFVTVVGGYMLLNYEYQYLAPSCDDLCRMEQAKTKQAVAGAMLAEAQARRAEAEVRKAKADADIVKARNAEFAAHKERALAIAKMQQEAKRLEYEHKQEMARITVNQESEEDTDVTQTEGQVIDEQICGGGYWLCNSSPKELRAITLAISKHIE